MISRHLHRHLVALAAAAAFAASAKAEPATNVVLAGHQVALKGGCVLLKVNFNVRVSYVSHFPVERGAEVRIALRALDPAQLADLAARRESIRPPDSTLAPVKSIDFEASRGGPHTLTIQFLREVAIQVGPGADFESVVVAIADPRSRKVCRPEFPMSASSNWSATVVPALAAGGRDADRASGSSAALPSKSWTRASGTISAANLNAAGAAMGAARAALKKADFAEAIRQLIKVLQYPENTHSSDAQELLGVVYQKNKQLADAKREYGDYLVRYPTSEGAEGVRQRLAAIETALEPRHETLRELRRPGASGPGQDTWIVSGSVSQFYVRDDSYRVLRDASLPQLINADKDDHRVHQNALLTSFDAFAAWGNNSYKSKFRFSGTEEHSFKDDGKEVVGISALFYETAIKDWGLLGRIGRQSRNTGGVLGRFDGGLLSWQATPWMRLNVVGGSPVVSRRDEPLKDDKIFFGASVDFGKVFHGFDVSLFALQQQVRDMIDRQSIGSELRYVDTTKAAFFTIDYDVHLNALNAVLLNGSWTLPDKATIYGGFDYRKSPYLSSWNALQGQQVTSLFELLKMRTRSEIMQMALDRTATYTSANIGYSRSLSDKLQLNLDASFAKIDGTIASFGVEATPATGNEFYYSAQLIASNMFRGGDVATIGLRFANRADSNTYAVDLGMRFPLVENWRVNPRLLMSYREGKGSDLREYSVMPTLLFDHYVTQGLAFELEIGAKRTWLEQAGVSGIDSNLFFTVGYRYDFHADGKAKCPSGATHCRE